MSDLVLHLKSVYFQQIKSGEKEFEYRLDRPYWIYRLFERHYDRVIFWDGYKKRSPETVIERTYRGYELQTITHPEFGPDPVRVFAIYAQEVCE
jgi:hypothetical protein